MEEELCGRSADAERCDRVVRCKKKRGGNKPPLADARNLTEGGLGLDRARLMVPDKAEGAVAVIGPLVTMMMRRGECGEQEKKHEKNGKQSAILDPCSFAHFHGPIVMHRA